MKLTRKIDDTFAAQWAYTSAIDGQSKRVSENLTFDEHGQVVSAEVFHGIPVG